MKIEDGSDTPPPAETVKQMWFAIKGDKMIPRRGLFLAQPAATLKLDPSKRPKAIDLLGFGQSRVDPPGGGQAKMVPNPEPVPGIYEARRRRTAPLPSRPWRPTDRPKEFKAPRQAAAGAARVAADQELASWQSRTNQCFDEPGRFIFLPGGDVGLGFRSFAGHLEWIEHAPWDTAHLDTPCWSIPWWAVVAGLAVGIIVCAWSWRPQPPEPLAPCARRE